MVIKTRYGLDIDDIRDLHMVHKGESYTNSWHDGHTQTDRPARSARFQSKQRPLVATTMIVLIQGYYHDISAVYFPSNPILVFSLKTFLSVASLQPRGSCEERLCSAASQSVSRTLHSVATMHTHTRGQRRSTHRILFYSGAEQVLLLKTNYFILTREESEEERGFCRQCNQSLYSFLGTTVMPVMFATLK